MPNTGEIQNWLITRLAEILHTEPDKIDIREPFTNYGFSSLDAVNLSGEMEEFIGRRLSPTITYDYPNILCLAKYLSEDPDKKPSSASKATMSESAEEPVAVIGMACRFPGANDPESFWRLLRDGIDMVSEVPGERWPKQAFYNPDPSVPGKSISYWGGFIENVDQFDPFFFGISPIEAKYMDPQQRLLLELATEAMDDAGQIKQDIDGSDTGVFVGISVNEYSQFQFSDPLQINSHSGTGSALSIAANRISYVFNFSGPSMAIDTACSSSLAAVHLACQSIRNNECKMALAGGVNIILSPAHSIAFTKAGVLAPDGRCKTFDARANGYVRGEGSGVIVLKRLSSALADGDSIHAVILGSAMRQDGRTNGLIAPSRERQEALLNLAYKAAGITPNSVQYIEAHGTGTILGDSMEANAIGSVVGADRKNGPCLIGSVKTNIGHLESAAGIAGLIKVIMSMKHEALPPSLHYHSPNPHIPFEELNLKVNNELSQWSPDSGPRIAGISSFGFGGTNVHMIVSEPPKSNHPDENNETGDAMDSKRFLFPLSAKSPEALKTTARDFITLFSSNHSLAVNDLCYAAGLRRSQYDYRLAVVGNSSEELSDSLHAYLRDNDDADLFTSSDVSNRRPKLAFIFSGQGGQWFGMGRELLKTEQVFYRAIEKIDRLIQKHYSWSLINELRTDDAESRIHNIDVIQPAIFSIQIALVELWKSWGVVPDAVCGHSMGEVAAAHIAGILTLEDAIKIICGRSKLLKRLSGKGSMIATELSADQAREIIEKYDNDTAIGVINSPHSTVLSGNPETLDKIMVSLQEQNLFCKQVNVDVASHSQQIDHLRSELLDVLNGLNPQMSSLPIYSTLTGARADNIDFNAEYWIDNLRKPVLFSDAVGHLLDHGHSIFVEIGPHPILLSSIQQSIKPHHQKISLLPSIRREESEREILLKSLAVLYTNGFLIDWKGLYPTGGKHVQLPPIPWQRQRYWIDAKEAGSKDPWARFRTELKNSHPLLGERMDLANSPSSYVWQSIIGSEVHSLLEDHRIDNEIVFPAAGYIEMAIASTRESGLDNLYELSDFGFKETMILQTGKSRTIQTLMVPDKENNFLFSVYSRTDPKEDWVLHASANLVKKNRSTDHLVLSKKVLTGVIRDQCDSEFTAEEFYQILKSRGIQFGKKFQVVQHIWSKGEQALGRIALPDLLQVKGENYQVHPALLDGCLQVIGVTQSNAGEHSLFLPIGCQSIRFFSEPGRLVWSHVTPRPGSGRDAIDVDIILSDDYGEIIAEIMGFRLQRTSRRVRQLLSQQDTWLYQLKWQAGSAETRPPIILQKERHWLIFADNRSITEELAKQLETNGDQCHIMICNEAITNQDSINENALLDNIEKFIIEISLPIYGIVHMGSFSTVSLPGILNSINERSLLNCNTVLYLIQALSKRIGPLPRLWLVTRGAQQVSGEEIAVEQSPLWGLGKVISFEIPELKCMRIDLDPLASDADNVQFLFEQISINDTEDQIAFRNGDRFVLRLLPFSIKTSTHHLPLTFRQDCTYLITGGLGALGLNTARWMASRRAKHLVLLGRNKPSRLSMDMIDQLRAQGIDIVIAQADVSNRDQLEKVVEHIGANMPVLRGIIHAAGVLDDGSLLNLNSDRMKKVMAPKVDGSWNLHNATMKTPLDFFVLFSSAVSVLGSPGQGNYAAASSYQDAFAHFRRSMGLPAISINWGPWGEVGLAAEATERLKEQNASTQHLIKVINIDRGLEILGELLTESTPQVMVLPFELKNLIELYPAAAGMPFLSEVGGSDTHVARLYARPKLRQKYVAPRNEIEHKLAELWRQTLHIDSVGIHDSFFELGGDSVLAAQILALAQKTFGIRINPQDAFKAFTIERLAELLKAEIINKIETMTEEEAERRLSN